MNNYDNNDKLINILTEKIEKSDIPKDHLELMINTFIEDIDIKRVDPRFHYHISKEQLVKLGILASMVSGSIFIPQAIKMYSSKNVEGVSLTTYFLSVTASCLWFTYNYLDGDYVSAVTSFLNFLIVSSIIIMILSFSKK